MSFDMTQIKRKSKPKWANPRECMSYVSHEDRATENVRYALEKYVDYRLKQRNGTSLTVARLQTLVNELFEFCCNKSYLKVSRQDIINNEDAIIYEVKKAIYYGATKHLYDAGNTIKAIRFEDLAEDPFVPKIQRSCNSDSLEKQEVEDYFKDLMI